MSICISVVEDNKSFRAPLVQLIGLTDGFLLVSEYTNAEEAEALVYDNPDIVIVDIRLPGRSGIELIQKIKPLNKAIQYLVCSNYDDDENIFTALEAGAAGYILKDYTAAEIIAAITELHNGGSPMKPGIARRVIASFQKKNKTPLFLLTDREKEVLELSAKGYLYKEVARQLLITHETVKQHLKNIYQKLQVQNKIEAINKFKAI
ncbi:MAG: response regulator transcription factor [Bacteroidota bacterium]|nr:response regulator transcription factor [Bacteroidota bacterium]